MKKINVYKILVIIAFLLGVSLRAYYMLAPIRKLSTDEAVYAVETLHILKGARPIFYYAQPYTGTPAAYFSAVLIKLFGHNEIWMKVPPLLASIALLYLSFILAKKVFSNSSQYSVASSGYDKKNTGYRLPTTDYQSPWWQPSDKIIPLLTLFFTSLTSPFWLNWVSRAGTCYQETMVFGTLILIWVIDTVFNKSINQKINKSKNQKISHQHINTSVHQCMIQQSEYWKLEIGNWKFGDILNQIQNNFLSLNFRFFLMGFCAGFGFWIQPAIGYYLLPAAFFLWLWDKKIFLRPYFYFGILGVLIGASPVIYENIRSGGLTSESLIHKPRAIIENTIKLFTEGLPVLIGTRAPWSYKDYYKPLGVVIQAIYLASFLAVLWARKRRLLNLLLLNFKPDLSGQKTCQKTKPNELTIQPFNHSTIQQPDDQKTRKLENHPLDLLILFVFSVYLFFILSPTFAWFVIEPRYISPLLTVLPIFVAWFIYRIGQIGPIGPIKTGFFLPAILVLLLTTQQIFGIYYSSPNSFLRQFKLNNVIAFLKSKNVKYVTTQMETAYQLIFDTQEEIIATPNDSPFGANRYPPYIEMVQKAPRSQKGWVLIPSLEEKFVDPCDTERICGVKEIDNYLKVYWLYEEPKKLESRSNAICILTQKQATEIFLALDDVKNFLNQPVQKAGGFITKPIYEIKEKKEGDIYYWFHLFYDKSYYKDPNNAQRSIVSKAWYYVNCENGKAFREEEKFE